MMTSEGNISRGSFQSANPECQERSCENDRGFFCKKCTLGLCRKCIQAKHEGHDWVTLKERATECQHEAKSFMKKLEELEEKKKAEIRNLKAMVKKNGESFSKTTQEIDNRENIMKYEVQEYSRELKRQFEVHHQDRENELQDLISQKEDEISKLELYMEFFESGILSSTDAHVVEYTHDIQLKIESSTPFNFGSLKGQSQFVAGRNNLSELRDLLGRSQTAGVIRDDYSSQQNQEINLQEVSHFKFSPGLESTILCMVSEDMAFHHTEHRKVQLSNDKGHSIQEFDIGRNPELSGHQLYTFTKLADDDLIFCCRNQRSLWRMNRSGWITCIRRDLLYYPTGLLTLKDGNLLICYASKRFNFMKSSTGMVSILNVLIDEESRSSPTFKLVKNFTHNADASGKLFKWPYRAAENKNTDLCIVDFLTTESSVLKVVDRQGNLRFCYSGQFLSKPFLATSVACDNHCRVIVNDNLNHRIHLLSQEGSFMKFIWKKPNSYPWALALSPSCSFLWVHFQENTMKVFRYENSESDDGNIQ